MSNNHLVTDGCRKLEDEQLENRAWTQKTMEAGNVKHHH
jgi:hypothetical protein